MADEGYHAENEGEFVILEPEIPKALTKDEASDCLNCVGPTFRKIDKAFSYSSCSYAYVAMDVVGRDLTNVDVLPYFAHVMFLDLSKNRLNDDSLLPLGEMEQLVTLVVDENRLESAVVPMFPQLQILSLRHNRITTCEVNIQPNLEYLELEGRAFKDLKPDFKMICYEDHLASARITMACKYLKEGCIITGTLEAKGSDGVETQETRKRWLYNFTKIFSVIAFEAMRTEFQLNFKLCRRKGMSPSRAAIDAFHSELQKLPTGTYGNNIQKIQPKLWGPKRLPKLKELGLRNNGLKRSVGINFPNLVSLFLADNEITVLEGLEVLTNLKFLHLRNNPLKKLDGFSEANRKLFYLNVRGCKIKNAKELKKLAVLPRLERIVVMENPFSEKNYRVQVIAMLPNIRRIDKTLVEKNEKRKAKRLAKRMSERGGEGEGDEENEETEIEDD